MHIADHIKPISYLKSEATQQTIALLNILAIGQKHIDQAAHEDGDAFFSELDELDREQKLR